jgi:hypothetical protein
MHDFRVPVDLDLRRRLSLYGQPSPSAQTHMHIEEDLLAGRRTSMARKQQKVSRLRRL